VTGLTALLLAGVRPGGDPFAEAHGVAAKALITVGGEPMIARPIRALLAAARVGKVVVLTQRRDLLAQAVPADPRIHFQSSGATIAATLAAILADPDTRYPLLVTTADHALLTPAMVDQLANDGAGVDLAIGVVERRALAARFPDSRRTWIAFKGEAFTGANLFLIGSARAARAVDLWRGVEQDRKKGWRLLAALGWPGLLGLLRLRTLDETMAAMGGRLGITLAAVRLADPVAAIDVDKPTDLALANAIIEGRQ
jgi:GTP:adenosylcobinamide-phosphate guanylyltransferase